MTTLAVLLALAAAASLIALLFRELARTRLHPMTKYERIMAQFHADVEAMGRAIGEALTPPLRALCEAFEDVVKGVTR